MLHVKHWHVLVNRDLKPFRRRGRQQRVELRDVQIVAGSDAFETEMIFEIIRRDPVRDVQRKIADAPRVREKSQMIMIADEIAVGVAGADLLENPVVARLEDARRATKIPGEDGELRMEDGAEQPSAV